jgi:glutamate N-acetyltransferase/amino-acid N-acetyltransferase
MAYGADPNVGRVFMAVGKCFDCTIATDRLRADINGTTVIENGRKSDFDEPGLRSSLSGDPVDLVIDLGVGDGEAVAYGCDLTQGYIEENAAYYSS